MKLTVFSALTFASLIKACREGWGRIRFWITFLGVMALRTWIYVLVLRRFPDLPLILFAVVTAIESPFSVTVLSWLNYSRRAGGIVRLTAEIVTRSRRSLWCRGALTLSSGARAK